MDEKVIQAGMFDQKSTGSERQQFLHSILHQDDADDEEENEVPDDETVNDMISRSEDEFKLFQQMDIDRRREEAACQSRLLDESELPEWLVKDEDEVEALTFEEDEDKSLFGRGSRQRKEVDYTNSLTEKEWLNAIGEEGIDIEEEEEEDDKKKKSTRKRRKKGEDDDDDEPITKKKKLDSKVKKLMKKIISAVINYTDPDGEQLSEPFLELPSRVDFPDYYKIIKKPLAINKLVQKINESKYCDLNDLEKDFMQLCKNAQTYNEEKSLIHTHSIILQNVFLNARHRLEAEFITLMEEDHKEVEDGNDESSVKMKIKLKGKKNEPGTSRSGRKKKANKKFISDDEGPIGEDN